MQSILLCGFFLCEASAVRDFEDFLLRVKVAALCEATSLSVAVKHLEPQSRRHYRFRGFSLIDGSVQHVNRPCLHSEEIGPVHSAR
jgi:hypothetical protein